VQWERGGDRYDVIFDAVGKRKGGAGMVNSAAVLAPGARRYRLTTASRGC
jgi:hypothetical protein